MCESYCEGKDVYLRVVERSDAPLIAKWKRDPVVQRMALDPGVDVSFKKEGKDIKRALKSKDQLYLVVVKRDNEQPIGYVRINWLESSHRFAWLRFALGEHRGQGHAKDALQHFLARLFTDGAQRVEAEVYEFNEVSLGLLKGLGFKREGVKRHACFDGDRFHDIMVLGLLATEMVPIENQNDS